VTTNAGNDTVIAGSGADNISTGGGDDTIRFLSANFTSADTVSGGDGSDTIEITNDAVVIDADFTNMTSIETLLLSGTGAQSVTLDGTIAQTAGIRTVTATQGNASTINIAGTTAGLTVATNLGNDTVYAGSGNDNISTGNGDDLIVFNATQTLTIDDTVNGGGDNDTVRVDMTGDVTFSLGANFTNVETLLLDDKGVDGFDASITLTSAFNNGEDLTIDASNFDAAVFVNDVQTVSGETLTLDASAVNTVTNSGDSLTVLGGAGNDTIMLGVGSDSVNAGDGDDLVTIALTSFTDNDSIDGDTGTDTLRLTTSGNVADTLFTNVTSMEILELANGTNNVTLHTEAYNAGNGISTVVGGTGNDTITTYADDVARGTLTVDLTSGGNDTVIIRNANWNGAQTVTTDNGGNGNPGSTYSYLTNFLAPANAHTFGVQTEGFVATGANADKLDIVYDVTGAPHPDAAVATAMGLQGFDGTSSGQALTAVRLNSTNLSGAASGDVIILSSEFFTLSGNWNIGQVAGQLSNNGAGNALVNLNDGYFTVVAYSDRTATADAYLFNIRVDGGDGFDLSWTTTQGRDFDMIEYAGVLEKVGADVLSAANFI